MLMITVEDDADILTVRVEGSLAGPNARDLVQTWPASGFYSRNRLVLFDLEGVTTIDAIGKEFLMSIFRDGNVLAAGATTQQVVDEIIRESAGYHPGIDDEAGSP